MIQRCTNPNVREFMRYGGRGIQVCARWMSFEGFLEDMGDRPPGLQLDRWPDNDGNYELGNARWATPKQQSRNTRRNRIVTISGITGCLAEVCERLGVDYVRVRDRLAKGWPLERAFTFPVRP